MSLASLELTTPVGDVRRIEVKREANFGDFIEMERRGWMEDGQLGSRYKYQGLAYMIWQLTGLPLPDVERLSRTDMGAVIDLIGPFVFDATSPDSQPSDRTE